MMWMLSIFICCIGCCLMNSEFFKSPIDNDYVYFINLLVDTNVLFSKFIDTKYKTKTIKKTIFF